MRKSGFGLKIIVGGIIIFAEEYLFYMMVLSEMLTKSNDDIWITFIVGSFVISAINLALSHILFRCTKNKHGNTASLPISAVLVSIFLCVLSCALDKPLLAEMDYRNETSYFIILIFSLFIDVWTILFAMFTTIILKLKAVKNTKKS